jgi:hypothetical protein
LAGCVDSTGKVLWYVASDTLRVISTIGDMLARAVENGTGRTIILEQGVYVVPATLTMLSGCSVVGEGSAEQCVIELHDDVNPVITSAKYCSLVNIGLSQAGDGPTLRVTAQTTTLRNCNLIRDVAGDSIVMTGGIVKIYDSVIREGDINLSTALCTLSVYYSQFLQERAVSQIETAGNFAHVMKLEHCDLGGQAINSQATGATTLALRGCTNLGTITNAGSGAFTTTENLSIHAAAADPHTGYVKESEFTASDDVLVGTGAGTLVKKTPAELLAILSGDSGATFSWNNQLLSAVKGVLSTAPTELTIAAGAVTCTQMFHTVDTEADAASDDLDTITNTPGLSMFVIRPESGSRTVVIKHNTGNIWTLGAADISLDDASDMVVLVWDNTNSKWCVVGGAGGDPKLAGAIQMFTKNITSAANAGDVTVATITTQACLIKSIVVKANAAQTADLGSIIIAGGTSKVVTFIDIVTGVQGNIAATDQQVSWVGAAALDATDTIVITLAGSGATAVDLQVTVEYEAVVSGGYLA